MKTKRSAVADKKKCGKCGEVKPLIEFHKNATSALGRASSCKKCKKEYNKQHHLENREPRLAIGRKYYEENKDKVSKRKQKYYKENRELWQQQQKQYYQENREKVLARQIAHNKGKKAEKKEYDKQYREDTKDKRNKWYRDKYQNDIEYRLHHLIKAGIHKALKRNCDEQGEGTMRHLTYTSSQLKEHLENQFQPWMTWDNQGEWHIHQIIPQSKLRFDSVTHPNFQKCWALENLMPLEAMENMSLGNREMM